MNTWKSIKMILSVTLNMAFSCLLLPQTSATGTGHGKISFNFIHEVNGSPVLYDTLIYTNSYLLYG